jgi:hypothetical protein
MRIATTVAAPQDPLRLVLQRSDFPAKTNWRAARYPSVDKTLAAAGFKARSADYTAGIPRGSTETLFVSGAQALAALTTYAEKLKRRVGRG